MGTLELGRAGVFLLVFCSYEPKIGLAYIFMLRNAPQKRERLGWGEQLS